jgi:hypothetical protein
MKWSTLVVTGAIACGLIALVVTLPAPTSPYTFGQVRCASDNPVVGIWVEAYSGGRGWADREAVAGSLAHVSFRRELPSGGTYMLSVGCGGTPKNWAVPTKSDNLSRAGYNLVCYDVPGDERFGTCD